jgi:hypothetical protein
MGDLMADDEREKSEASIQKLMVSLRGLNTSILAAALVSAAKRPYSIAEILELRRDVDNALVAKPNDRAYVEWAKTKKARLNRVHE